MNLTPFLFAGLWEHWWPVKDAEPVLTFTIITGPPGIVSGDMHDRAPLTLPPESCDAWLKGAVEDAKRIVETTTEPELAAAPPSKGGTHLRIVAANDPTTLLGATG